IWNTEAGHLRVKEILAKCQPPIYPHDYQTEGICVSLDNKDLLATMATGMGKTGFFSFTMLVALAIKKDPSLAMPGAPSIPDNPAMLLILPTKALQEDMRKSMAKLGLDVVVINGDTCAEAEKSKRNLWEESKHQHNIILISPEELLSPSFRHLIENKAFSRRTWRFGVDEVHLIYTWGQSFRESFLQMGNVRARLESTDRGHIPLIAASATIREGPMKDTICQVLGLQRNQYHFLRRSNRRSDIQILVRPIESSPTSFAFPELDWIIDEKESTVIFCKTIALGFRVTVHLWRLAVSK
ncbi:P-loop containing nucleoside triphosphate hydrolase protein, partial [Coprinopsis sp. MPI-PUGE-AT-0042]